LEANDGLVLTGHLVDANMLVRRAWTCAGLRVEPHRHRLLLYGVDRKSCLRSVAESMFHELMSVFMAEFLKAA
jgi:hypothetical protein